MLILTLLQLSKVILQPIRAEVKSHHIQTVCLYMSYSMKRPCTSSTYNLCYFCSLGRDLLLLLNGS